MDRRTFLATAAGITAATAAAQNTPLPILDTHIHLYDPTRPQGVPWPPKDGKVPYRPMLPDGFRKITKPLGVVGAIEVECSPLLEDNQWVLDVAAKDPIMVGVVGNLEPANRDFRRHLDRFHQNPLFLGIRYGYLWGRSVASELPKPAFFEGLKALADAGLELDTVGPPQLLGEVVRITDKVPNLRIVIDHLPSQEPPKEAAALAAHKSNLRELGKRPQIFVKVSEVLRPIAGRVSHDLSPYRDRIDQLWDTFGADRVIYGSDWPNSDPLGTYPQVLHVVRQYFLAKGPAASEKFFWRNSLAAYRWRKRQASQPDAV